jgi:hypothetical protein
MNDTIRIPPNQPQDSPVEILVIQEPSVQYISAKTHRPRLAPIQVPKLAIPSPQIELLGLQNAQQKTPATSANLFLSPSPMMVVPALGTPSSSKLPTPTTPNTPTMPPTPIKHQSKIPGVIGQTPNPVANQPPALLPRSPRRPPPPGLVPVLPVNGEHNFGVIGDRRVSKNQPQPQVAGESKDKPEIKEDLPLAKLEPTQTLDGVDIAQDQEGQDSAESQSVEKDPEPIYVGQPGYYVGRHLGGGGMGRVYSVISRVTMGLSALKVIKRKNLDSDGFSMVKSEWTILKAISEAKFLYAKRIEGLQFVHHLMESWYDKEHIYFVMVCSAGFFTNLAD